VDPELLVLDELPDSSSLSRSRLAPEHPNLGRGLTLRSDVRHESEQSASVSNHRRRTRFRKLPETFAFLDRLDGAKQV
jgi:hypothetical protein